MNWHELQLARRSRWRLCAEGRVATAESAAEFMREVGMCLVYSAQPAALAPTLIGACMGSADGAPSAQHARSDPRAQQARELMLKLLRQRAVFEANFARENILLLSAEIFPYFYAVVGERNPKRELQELASGSKTSVLARDVYAAIQQKGPLTRMKLATVLGGALSEAALERTLHELWSRLLIARTRDEGSEEAAWDAMHRYAAEEVKAGSAISVGEGLSALLSKYLDAVIAATHDEIESFFSHFTSRGRVRDAVNALLAAREISFLPMGTKTLLQITPRVSVEFARMPRRSRTPAGKV